MSVHLLGIRHHGPGCARSLKAALAALAPDIVLVEGPPDADAALPFAANETMQPPVALLVYPPEAPDLAVFYPFAEFSPEWQAIRYAAAQKIPARFIDLPQTYRLADRLAQRQSKESQNEPPSAETVEETAGPPDPEPVEPPDDLTRDP